MHRTLRTRSLKQQNPELPLDTLLRRLGCSSAGVRVYLVLHKKGKQHIAGIAQAGGLHRPAVYRGIRELKKQQLVILTLVGARTWYVAVPTTQIVARFTELSHSLKKTVSTETVPVVKKPNRRFHIRSFSGIASVREVFDDVIATLKRGETFYRITAEQDVAAVDALLSSEYRKQRDAKRLERKVISNERSRRTKRKRLERFIRIIGSDAHPFLHNIIELVYADRIAYIDMTQYEAIVIQHQALADFHRSVFRELYTRLPAL